MADIRSILRQYWGYNSFRPLQEDIINHVMQGKDTLALLPTGGGKSICFQVPALALGGLCIVVTPLIALMKDQVRNLKERGIKAVAIHSGLRRNEIDTILDNCRFGDFRFLYLSPERLQSDLFRQRFKEMPVKLIAVDEAHCISQWGYDFRPPYLQIARIREIHPDVPVIALTATATPQVVDDIQEKLEFKEPAVFRKSFKRSNLAYVVLHEDAKLNRLLKILKNVPGSSVVYVRNRKKTKEIAAFLQKQAISADYYHAGLPAEEKSEKELAWRKGKCRVIVSTNAFGMGIDKPDVRSVVHMDLPDSLEAYFQEAGRAGRDEEKAYAVLLFDPADRHKVENLLNEGFPNPDELKAIYHSLGNYLGIAVGAGEGETFPFDLPTFCKKFNFSPLKAYYSFKLIEQMGLIVLSDAVHSPAKLKIIATREQLYKIQVEKPALEPVIQLLLRTYPGIFDDHVILQVNALSSKLNTDYEGLMNRLTYLEGIDFAEFSKPNDKPRLTLLLPRQSPSGLAIDLSFVEGRKKEFESRLQAILNYIGNNHDCRTVQLCAYFGETDTERCGICDVCLARNKTGLNDRRFESIRQQIIENLQREPHSLPYLTQVLGLPEQDSLQVIRFMIDHNELREEKGKLIWQGKSA